METIAETPYQFLRYDEEKSLLVLVWKAETEHIDEEGLMREIGLFIQELKRLNVRYAIGDDRNFMYSLTPEVQEQVNQGQIANLNHTTLRKLAHVMSTEMMAQMSIEQLFEENVSKTYHDNYFDTLEEAIAWCMA